MHDPEEVQVLQTPVISPTASYEPEINAAAIQSQPPPLPPRKTCQTDNIISTENCKENRNGNLSQYQQPLTVNQCSSYSNFRLTSPTKTETTKTIQGSSKCKYQGMCIFKA